MNALGICLAGPTASGKSAPAPQLAEPDTDRDEAPPAAAAGSGHHLPNRLRPGDCRIALWHDTHRTPNYVASLTPQEGAASIPSRRIADGRLSSNLRTWSTKCQSWRTRKTAQATAAIICRRGSRVNASAARKAPMPSENAPMKSHA